MHKKLQGHSPSMSVQVRHYLSVSIRALNGGNGTLQCKTIAADRNFPAQQCATGATIRNSNALRCRKVAVRRNSSAQQCTVGERSAPAMP